MQHFVRRVVTKSVKKALVVQNIKQRSSLILISNLESMIIVLQIHLEILLDSFVFVVEVVKQIGLEILNRRLYQVGPSQRVECLLIGCFECKCNLVQRIVTLQHIYTLSIWRGHAEISSLIEGKVVEFGLGVDTEIPSRTHAEDKLVAI